MSITRKKSHFWELILRRFVVLYSFILFVLFTFRFDMHLSLIVTNKFWGIVIFNAVVVIIIIAPSHLFFFRFSKRFFLSLFFHQFVAGSCRHFHTPNDLPTKEKKGNICSFHYRLDRSQTSYLFSLLLLVVVVFFCLKLKSPWQAVSRWNKFSVNR